MFRNYFRIALRTLTRNKLYTTINITGLVFGLSCFLLIGLYVFDELTFDRQHSKADRIYRVIEHKTINGEYTVTAGAGYKLAEESKEKIPGVENTTRIQRTGRANIINPEDPTNFFQETVTIADNSLLEIFDFPLIAGDKKTALKEQNSIIITQDLAMRLFKRTDVTGKTLQFSFMKSPLKITGILKNHPHNSSFDFSSVISEASFLNDDSYKQAAEDWLSENYSVYALLRPNADANSAADEMSKLVHDNFTAPEGTTFFFSLQPLKDIHLNSKGIADGARNSNVSPIAQGSMLYIRIFTFIAFFVLLIAGINYMNLTTARASSRLKEIGVRKTIGALNNNLAIQFLFESLLITFIAFLLCIPIVEIVLPAFNRFTSKELIFGFSTDYRIWMYIITFVILSGLLSGSYPALMLSRFKPILLLKGFRLRNKTDLSLRKGLVIFQFTISIVMIIATIVLFLQLKYLTNINLGFNKDLLVVIDVNTNKARTNFEAVKDEMAKIPNVKNVCVTSRVPGDWKTYRTIRVKNQGSSDEGMTAYFFGADKDFLKTYKIELLSGRNFNSPGDSDCVLLNETAAKMLKIEELSDQTIMIPAFSRGGDFTPLNSKNISFAPKVTGIIKDFHFQSLRNKIEPLVIAYNQNPIHNIDYYTVSIAAMDIHGTLGKLKAIMVNNDRRDPFEYHFLDEQIARFYIDDERRETILIWAALATIFIACLGLFGLATYSSEQRIKEVGVRKVLGANIFSIVSLLSKDFLKLVLTANIIAFPLAWWAVSMWLQEYAYHIKIEWWIFAATGISACIIAVLTVSYQAIKAAFANPVESLRYE